MKTITKRVTKTCSMCGKVINIKIYNDKSYRGGHFMGKIGIATKKEEARAHKAGARPWNFLGRTLYVMNESPKPYKYVEDWECPKCYWP